MRTTRTVLLTTAITTLACGGGDRTDVDVRLATSLYCQTLPEQNEMVSVEVEVLHENNDGELEPIAGLRECLAIPRTRDVADALIEPVLSA